MDTANHRPLDELVDSLLRSARREARGWIAYEPWIAWARSVLRLAAALCEDERMAGPHPHLARTCRDVLGAAENLLVFPLSASQMPVWQRVSGVRALWGLAPARQHEHVLRKALRGGVTPVEVCDAVEAGQGTINRAIAGGDPMLSAWGLVAAARYGDRSTVVEHLTDERPAIRAAALRAIAYLP